MHLSYWEYKSWFQNVDFTIVGSGIVGLHAALNLRARFPESKILIIEIGSLPEGASTKNAGFACFGSLSEIVDDLKIQAPDEVYKLIAKRWEGLQLLRNRIGDEAMDFQQNGGYELFTENDKETFDECLEQLDFVNELLFPLFKSPVFKMQKDVFGFQKIHQRIIFNPFEAQIDTGKMMQQLLKIAYSEGILILNNQSVTDYQENDLDVKVNLADFSFSTKKLLFATNGFSKTLFIEDVQPARAQVLITKPISDLKIKGTFHLDKGYYYFRNIDNRILFGGGRNLDFKGETTTDFGNTNLIQNELERLLKEVILPNHKFEIEHRWSGIMGMGQTKNPIVKQLSNHIYCGVRLGGMGIAIGSLVGKELADLV
ncbi:FAD-binding oxidoreductase [Flavobacterium antarcticum]|uniref:NAD(P)/FAD-dependent oxidoreductase n=1 Tax=Flavobacterium antarcticum TaxID=271155 RepID=UPI0003B69543|nr:FAD-dependent oxidoreductase [Flavobacterium antarcticum]